MCCFGCWFGIECVGFLSSDDGVVGWLEMCEIVVGYWVDCDYVGGFVRVMLVGKVGE